MRIIEGVRKKLDEEMRVEDLVDKLVLEAMDPARLSIMYEGWMSWI